MVVSVQYQVIQQNLYDAFYKLTDSRSQITSYVFDVVRYVLLDSDARKATNTSLESWWFEIVRPAVLICGTLLELVMSSPSISGVADCC